VSRRVPPLALALLVLLPAGIGAQSAPAFSGRYRFVFTVSPSCPPTMQVGPLTVLVDVAESTVDAVTEVSGQSASPSEVPENGRFELLRQGDHLHGAFGAHTQYLGLDTTGTYRLWLEIMTDGAVTTAASGRARAAGTAFGEVELSLASDPTGDPLKPDGNCGFTATGHTWSLEPA